MLRIRRLINRWNFAVFILFLIIKFLQFLRIFGIKGKEDGWRRATRAFLMTEHSKFILACFGLNFLTNDRADIINKLAVFLQRETAIHWQIQYSRFSAKRVKKDFIDIVHAEFNADGSLASLIPYLYNSESLVKLSEEVKADILQEIVKFYNQTRNLPDKKRPWFLTQYLERWLYCQRGYRKEIKIPAESYLNRILSANFICFEEIPKDDKFNSKRFEVPHFVKRKHPGAGLLNIVCRFNSDGGIDLWFQCHHIAIDGMPMQEILQRLKQEQGISGRIKFPDQLYKNNPISILSSTEKNEKGIYLIVRLVNFFPLLKVEKTLNIKYTLEGRRGVTLLRIFIWKLGNHPVFKGIKFLIPVDIRSRNGRERSLGFVIIRPSIYFNKNKPEKGFLEFHQEFNRQVKATIFRRSETYELLERYAVFAPPLYSLTLKLAPSAFREFIGTFGVTVISRAEAFIAPYSDVHRDGFMALSNITVSAKERVASCYVNIKGPKNKIEDYLKAIEEISKGDF